MSIPEKKNFIFKSKKAVKYAMLVFSIAFAFSFFAGVFATDGVVINFLGDISVFSALFFALSSVCLFLLQLEAWEKDYI